MRQRNPGSLGLIEGPRVEREEKYAKQAEQAERAQRQAKQALVAAQPQALQEAQQQVQEARRQAKKARKVRDEISRLNNDGLMQAIVDAINSLEENGYVAPYVCVFGRNPFQAAYQSDQQVDRASA